MNAQELMAAADALTEVRPGMTSAEIIRRVSITRETLMARYLIAEYKKTRDSAARADLVARMETLVAAHPHLKTSIDKALAGMVSMTRQAKGGRPRTHVSDALRQRQASRAYRARKQAKKEPPNG